MDVEDLIRSIDIVEYISQFVELEQRGDEFWGNSCFKEENTPSFSVRRDPPVFYDFSSGASGGLLTFVKLYFHCGGYRAVEILQEYAGVSGEISQKPGRIAATGVCRRFSRQNQTKKEASGVVLPDHYMERYEKRPEKLKIWENEGISERSLEKFEVYYDAFADRIVYPIRNMKGEIVNVGGRTLDPDWKAKGLRKYCYYYPWGTINTIYGLWDNMDDITEKGEVILFEGCKSVLLADTWGIRNTGAILTSHLSVLQMHILAKLRCDVVFALDRDVDIRDDRRVRNLSHYVNVSYIADRCNLLDEKDAPVDKGQAVFERLYEERMALR